ncbi:hypothetical protein [Candidatus Sulfurimonas baltica]|uniref:Uncharacterized protein n=1 Tax=Candidatus Sulfurimonas baltica TaxID=2740404 RepID=A0A7S7RP59_9BACT|nr:hypothetical protein [Candidatus Sulfurimonas baltica]QOY53143.1 hypothetical protein HUE88_05545 [Candidatus Sulfurimonas baltica]
MGNRNFKVFYINKDDNNVDSIITANSKTMAIETLKLEYSVKEIISVVELKTFPKEDY